MNRDSYVSGRMLRTVPQNRQGPAYTVGTNRGRAGTTPRNFSNRMMGNANTVNLSSRQQNSSNAANYLKSMMANTSPARFSMGISGTPNTKGPSSGRMGYADNYSGQDFPKKSNQPSTYPTHLSGGMVPKGMMGNVNPASFSTGIPGSSNAKGSASGLGYAGNYPGQDFSKRSSQPSTYQSNFSSDDANQGIGYKQEIGFAAPSSFDEQAIKSAGMQLPRTYDYPRQPSKFDQQMEEESRRLRDATERIESEILQARQSVLQKQVRTVPPPEPVKFNIPPPFSPELEMNRVMQNAVEENRPRPFRSELDEATQSSIEEKVAKAFSSLVERTTAQVTRFPLRSPFQMPPGGPSSFDRRMNRIPFQENDMEWVDEMNRTPVSDGGRRVQKQSPIAYREQKGNRMQGSSFRSQATQNQSPRKSFPNQKKQLFQSFKQKQSTKNHSLLQAKKKKVPTATLR